MSRIVLTTCFVFCLGLLLSGCSPVARVAQEDSSSESQADVPEATNVPEVARVAYEVVGEPERFEEPSGVAVLTSVHTEATDEQSVTEIMRDLGGRERFSDVDAFRVFFYTPGGSFTGVALYAKNENGASIAGVEAGAVSFDPPPEGFDSTEPTG